MRTRTHFVNNKDLLKEIHKSKISYCAYTDAKYTEYDAIVEDLNDITPELIHATLENKAAKINVEARAALREQGITRNQYHHHYTDITGADLDPNSLVFRLMTYSHIPLAPGRIKNPKRPADHHIRLNFPAFKHYIKSNGEFVEVLRSHWTGSLESGHFQLGVGRISHRLAKMMMLMVERYGQKINWRGYSYLDDMKGQSLVQLSEVALTFNEARSNNPFAYYTVVMNNCFTGYLNGEKKLSSYRDDERERRGVQPSLTRQLRNAGF